MTVNDPTYRKARIHPDPPWGAVKSWLSKSLSDLRRNARRGLLFGLTAVGVVWLGGLLLISWGLGWMLLPAVAGAVLIGPIATTALCRIARGETGTPPVHADTAQFILLGVILTVFALVWIRAATILFAIFFGLRPFSGPLETFQTLLTTPEGIGLIITGTLAGGLFAALGFAVSVFSVPMLLDREIDAFSAMGLSFNAVTHNFQLAVLWGAVVTALIALSAATGFLGLAIAYPLLGFATWHAYADLFHFSESDGDATHVPNT